MAAAFAPSVLGIFVFGLVAGICPCNSVLCLGFIGYLTSGETSLSTATIVKLVTAFCAGTVLVLLPLGAIAGFAGHYILFLNETIAWALGGVLLILMGLQLLHIYKPPIKSIFNVFRRPASFTALGTFMLGLSFGAITIGRGAPMLIIVLTYIALYQTPVQGLVTVLIYAVGLSIPLIVISSVGGAAGKKIRSITRMSGDAMDRAIGVLILLIGLYFLYLAVPG
jgi:cytochrome c-type biogenesis protein